MNRLMLFAATVLLCLGVANPCRAETTDLQASIDSAHEPIFDGLGSLHHPVTTKTNSTLAHAVGKVARGNRDDPDGGALFAESMMDLHPWGLWTLDGKPTDGTPEIVATLEGVMARFGDHLGLNRDSQDPGGGSPAAVRAG